MSVPAFRIAIRTEGHVVRAYYAKPDSMDDARLVISCASVILEQEGMADAFKDFVKLAVTRYVESEGGEVMGMIEQEPPAHEKAGHS